MKITFNGGKMIVTHQSGVVNTYDEAELSLQREQVKIDIKTYKTEVAYFDNLIKQVKASMPKLPILKRVAKLFARKEKTNALG